jgi:hypothetical protein
VSPTAVFCKKQKNVFYEKRHSDRDRYNPVVAPSLFAVNDNHHDNILHVLQTCDSDIDKYRIQRTSAENRTDTPYALLNTFSAHSKAKGLIPRVS